MSKTYHQTHIMKQYHRTIDAVIWEPKFKHKKFYNKWALNTSITYIEGLSMGVAILNWKTNDPITTELW